MGDVNQNQDLPEHSPTSHVCAAGPEEFARAQLEEFAARWPNSKIFTFDNTEKGADGPLRGYFTELVAMWHEFGAQRTADAVINASRRFEHPPRISQLRDCVPPPRKYLRPPDPNCPNCRGMRFRPAVAQNWDGGVVPCECGQQPA